MKKDADGFKYVEGGDEWTKGLFATYENTVLLHDQIKKLREELKQKGVLEGEKTEE